MATIPDPDQGFDLSAAGLRADGAQLRMSIEVLAAKLEQSLPDLTRVNRRAGRLLGRGERHVREIHVDLGASRYGLTVAGDRVEGFRQRQVGGISISREALDPEAWVGALTAELRGQAEHSAHARDALEELLG